jgi:hypothetical protein
MEPARRDAFDSLVKAWTDKYTEMLLDVAESILGVFGFSRIQFGFRRRTRSYMEELRGERAKEIKLELESLEPNV